MPQGAPSSQTVTVTGPTTTPVKVVPPPQQQQHGVMRPVVTSRHGTVRIERFLSQGPRPRVCFLMGLH